MKEIISSNQNPRVKQMTLLLDKASERRKQNLIVVEGLREISIALSKNFDCQTLYYCSEILNQNSKDLVELLQNSGKTSIEIAKHIFEKLAFRDSSDGLLMLTKPRFNKLAELSLGESPYIIILESVEKPGNLGAVLRTADASGADAVIVCDPKCDIYNPNTIRSSVGCVFSTQLVVSSSEEVYQWLLSNDINFYATAFDTENMHYEVNFRQATAIVFGTEADGLSDFWLSNATKVKIPMYGQIDSLNLSNSVAIITYESIRQKKFTNL